MASKSSGKKNVRDVTAAWEAFRNLIHSTYPISGQTINNATRLATKRRQFR